MRRSAKDEEGGPAVEGEDRERAADRLATLEALARGLAHDVRVPLGSLRINAELVRRAAARGPDDGAAERLARAAGGIDAGIARLKDLCDALFALLAPPPAIAVEGDLATALRLAADLAMPEARRRAIELRLETPAVPLPVSDARLALDLALHAIADAIARSQAGGRLLVRALAGGAELRVEIEDIAPHPAPGADLAADRRALRAARAAAAALGGAIEEVGGGLRVSLPARLAPEGAAAAEADIPLRRM
jgi:signal transduction histidine kinase